MINLKNPIKTFRRNRRYKKFVRKWDSDIDYILDQINDDKDLLFKWGQLVNQEIKMFIRLDTQVTQDEIEWLTDRRGFNDEMESYLINMLKHVGIGKYLKCPLYRETD